MNYVLIYNQNRKKRSEKLLFLFAVSCYSTASHRLNSVWQIEKSVV